MASKLTVKLDGVDVELVCTLGAARLVNVLHGGLNPCIANIRNMNLNTVSQVIAAATGKFNEKGINSIEAAIYRGGIANYQDACIKFITRLSNSGEDPVEATLNEDDGSGDGESQEGNENA